MLKHLYTLSIWAMCGVLLLVQCGTDAPAKARAPSLPVYSAQELTTLAATLVLESETTLCTAVRVRRGCALTAAHCTRDARQLTVEGSLADVLAVSKCHDLAALRVPPGPAVELAKIGDPFFVAHSWHHGGARLYTHSLANVLVSDDRLAIVAEAVPAMAPGASGSGLFDFAGRMHGVLSMIDKDNRAYYVPLNVLQQMTTYCEN